MTTSGDDTSTPTAAGAAAFGGNLYIVARRPDSTVGYRTTDGSTYSDWVALGGATYNHPAVAATQGNAQGDFLDVFARGVDNALYVQRMDRYGNWSGWTSLGGILTAAPAAASIYGRVHVFVRGADNTVYSKYSNDGLNFSDWMSLGGVLHAAPVALSDNNQVLTVFGKGYDSAAGQYKIYYMRTGDGTSGASFSAWAIWRDTAVNGPADAVDFPLVLDVGVNFIGPSTAGIGDTWGNYQLPAFSQMRPQLAKFNMFYDGGLNVSAVFDTTQLDQAIGQGVKTIVFRTAETQFSAADVETQVRWPLRPNGDQSMIDYIANHPGIDFWIQVGNEPDRALPPYTTSAGDALTRFLDCLRNEIPKYRPGGYRPLANLRWLASMPTYVGNNGTPICCDFSYLDTLLNNSELVQGYDALGASSYGGQTLFKQFPGGPGGDETSSRVLDRVLARTNRPVLVTEAGIDGCNLPWSSKANLYVQALYRMPSRVRGYTFYTLTRDPDKTQGADPSREHYGIDVPFVGNPYPACTPGAELYPAPDPNYAGAKIIGAR